MKIKFIRQSEYEACGCGKPVCKMIGSAFDRLREDTFHEYSRDPRAATGGHVFLKTVSFFNKCSEILVLGCEYNGSDFLQLVAVYEQDGSVEEAAWVAARQDFIRRRA
jgi:hypothetical protein